MPRWVLRRAQGQTDLSACLAVRQQVFVREQGVEEALERDGLDHRCIHYIAVAGSKPVGTARVLPLDECYKIQRMAVLADQRGGGLGTELMRFIMADLGAAALDEGRHFFLSSQSHAVAFYEKLGFAVCSDEYVEAGILHRDMTAPPIA